MPSIGTPNRVMLCHVRHGTPYKRPVWEMTMTPMCVCVIYLACKRDAGTGKIRQALRGQCQEDPPSLDPEESLRTYVHRSDERFSLAALISKRFGSASAGLGYRRTYHPFLLCVFLNAMPSQSGLVC